MNRRAFAALGASALVVFPRIARATGGIDVANPEARLSVRVLLASGEFDAPRTLDEWHFSWGGRTYRGAFSETALPGGERGLLNIVPLDAYLAGVISSEMPPGWPDAAQRAQAIVSRTYVRGRLRPDRAYDVVPTESDQRYTGIEGESVSGRAGVDATAGRTLAYLGKPALAAYSSCCGGRTASSLDAWNAPYPYLVSIADPHCLTSPAYEWETTVSFDALAQAFGATFASLGNLREVVVTPDSAEARPANVEFEGSRGRFETTPKALRAALGSSVVRSTYVRAGVVEGRGVSVTFHGTGRGHGVGLCQWGARQMALDGSSAEEILTFYFPGTQVTT